MFMVRGSRGWERTPDRCWSPGSHFSPKERTSRESKVLSLQFLFPPNVALIFLGHLLRPCCRQRTASLSGFRSEKSGVGANVTAGNADCSAGGGSHSHGHKTSRATGEGQGEMETQPVET